MNPSGVLFLGCGTLCWWPHYTSAWLSGWAPAAGLMCLNYPLFHGWCSPAVLSVKFTSPALPPNKTDQCINYVMIDDLARRVAFQWGGHVLQSGTGVVWVQWGTLCVTAASISVSRWKYTPAVEFFSLVFSVWNGKAAPSLKMKKKIVVVAFTRLWIFTNANEKKWIWMKKFEK